MNSLDFLAILYIENFDQHKINLFLMKFSILTTIIKLLFNFIFTVPSVQLESLTTFFNKSPSSSKVMSFRENLYERAIGQHVFKSSTAHPDHCRYGDFESKGRASDF